MQEMVVQRSKESKSLKKNQICKLGGLAIIHNNT
jgi:hypothetical protein